jgi:two-component system CitB family sensor kinase
MNRMHTVVSLIELGHTERALAFAVEELHLAQRLTDRLVSSVSEPALAALLLGKAAQAAELGVAFEVDEDSNLPSGLVPARDLVTIVGNLVDNAFDATLGRSEGENRPRAVRVSVIAGETEVRLTVADSGDGPPPDTAVIFTRGWSTKPDDAGGRGLGLALVQQTVGRLHGRIDVREQDGAVFEVVLPRWQPGARPGRHQTPPEGVDDAARAGR